MRVHTSEWTICGQNNKRKNIQNGDTNIMRYDFCWNVDGVSVIVALAVAVKIS